MRLAWSRGKSYITVRLDLTEGAWRMKFDSNFLGGATTAIRKPADAEAELRDCLLLA